MRRISHFAFALASLSLVSVGVQAEPAHHRHHAARPVRHVQQAAAPKLVVKRSFLDSGNVVPVGTLNRYMDDSTVFNGTPGGTYRNELFGDNTILPGPFDLPGIPGFQRYAPW
ncbi:hypothetical protein [uncultured Rhodoblastus sp.]|uniref:hypothetical protein n=1 Tax=uncultured Rhodoblastus sp. TaxID=543037 RepID=UPI0025DBD1D4|nr:hypothetical protein [uncultured Rhodoblastus sp.]